MKRYRVTPGFVIKLMKQDHYITRYILPGDVLTLWDKQDDYNRLSSSRNEMTILYVTDNELRSLESLS